MNAREVANCFREDCRTLRDSLQLEMVVAQYCLRMRDAVTHEGVPIGAAVRAGVVSSLEHDADPLAHALLKALAGEYVMFVDFEYPRGAAHALALFVEPRGGGRVKHIGLTHPVRDFPDDAAFDPHAMKALEIPEAGELLAEAMERAFGTDLAKTDDYTVLIGAARVGSMQAAPAGGAPHPARAASVPAADASQCEHT
jgi:hypothetical protein